MWQGWGATLGTTNQHKEWEYVADIQQSVSILCGIKKYTHRVVSLIDAEQEDELREEERCYQVPVDGVEVGADPAQEAQQDEGDEEEEHGDRDRGVGDNLQWENITMLWRTVPRQHVKSQ